MQLTTQLGQHRIEEVSTDIVSESFPDSFWISSHLLLAWNFQELALEVKWNKGVQHIFCDPKVAGMTDGIILISFLPRDG